MQKIENKTNTSKIRRKFFIFIISILVIGTAWYKRPAILEWIKTFNSKTETLEKLPAIEPFAKLQNQTSNSNEQIKQQNDQDLSSLRNHITEPEKISTDQVDLNIQQTNLFTKSINSDLSTNIKFLEDYRHYLYIVTRLITNFLQGEPYTSEITQLPALDYPKSIKTILTLLDGYNSNYLINYNNSYKNIFPKDGGIIERFIKVGKITSDQKERELVRIKIIENLDEILDYFYSEKLQNIFINRVK